MKPKPFEKIFYRKKEGIWLFVAVFVSISILILANYYTLKVSNSIRAYVKGESEYSKGQKNACISLILFVEKGEEQYLESFEREISIPHNDGLALEQLLDDKNGINRSEIRNYFVNGNNHPDDINNMIWLFRTFRNFDFMESAIDIWDAADMEIDSLIHLSEELRYPEKSALILSDSEKQQLYIGSIEAISNRVNVKEAQFSNVLGETARKMGSYLFWVNILMIAFIFGLLTLFYKLVIRNMKRFQQVLQINNLNLTETNQKLDQLIYATSHDLKAPVNNIQGLINISKLHSGEVDPFQVSILNKMEISLESLTGTLQDIESMMRIDRDPWDDYEDVNIEEMINLIFLDSQIVRETDDFEVVKNLQAKTIYFPEKGMKSVLFNLIHNAVKFRNFDRKLTILVESEAFDDGTWLKIKDNGLGIDIQKHGNDMFNMFRRLHDHVPGSGLGLYVVRRILERNGGTISVESELGVGTTFILFFKKEVKM